MRLRVQVPAGVSILVSGTVLSIPQNRIAYPLLEQIAGFNIPMFFWPLWLILLGSALIYVTRPKALVVLLTLASITFFFLGVANYLSLGPTIGTAFSLGWVIACSRGAVDLKTEIQRLRSLGVEYDT